MSDDLAIHLMERVRETQGLAQVRDLLDTLHAAVPDMEHSSFMEGMAHGAILQKLRESERAAASLKQLWHRFPTRFEAAYEYACNAVDGSLYQEARKPLDHLIGLGADLPESYLRGVCFASAAAGFHDLSLEAALILKARGSAFMSDATFDRVSTACANQRMDRMPPVVSIGENCLPWMLPNRWGLRRQSTYMCDNSIFNLLQTTPDGVARSIRALGRDVTNADLLETVADQADFAIPFNKQYHYMFVHEASEYWMADRFANLRARYDLRVQNFCAYLEGLPRTFFFYTQTPGDIMPVVDAVEAANRDENYKLLVVDACATERACVPADSARVRYLRLDLPTPDYVWFRPTYLDSPSGIAFEKSIYHGLVRLWS